MFDHLEFKVKDLKKSKALYENALKPLGVHVQFATETMAGFGTGEILGADGKERTEFLIEAGQPQRPPMHIAFSAPSREAVDKFHEAAMRHGAVDNGGPGLRSDYHATYYAAFVLDPDGHNVEAVYHGSPRNLPLKI